MADEDLDSRLLTAHAANDRAALITLYAEAADAATEPERAAFYLTHAWVFALEADDPRAQDFHKRLHQTGRAD